MSTLVLSPDTPIKSKLQYPPPRANPGYLTTICAREVGNLTGRSSRGKENDLCLGGVGKFEPEVLGSVSDFFFRAPKSLTDVNTCLDGGRDRTFVSDWLTKQGLQKL